MFKQFGDFLKSKIDGVNPFKEKTYYFGGSPPPQAVQQTAPVGQNSVTTPVATPMPATPMPTGRSLNGDVVGRMIQVYGGKDAPILTSAPQIAQRANQYQFWRDNPELLALIPHLETSSGRNITRNNNWANWSARNAENNQIFATMEPVDVFGRMLSGIAERMPAYSRFRTNQPLTDQELMDFANVYEPANPDYGPNLVKGRSWIRQNVKY